MAVRSKKKVVAKGQQKHLKASEPPSYHEELAKAKEGLSPEQQKMLEKAYTISKGRFG